MRMRRRIVKDADYETRFPCAGGEGILREEVWTDATGEVVRYNLAFIVPHKFWQDKGRVLGYDNAHGIHERHYRGAVEPVSFTSYRETSEKFFREVQKLRREYEDENHA